MKRVVTMALALALGMSCGAYGAKRDIESEAYDDFYAADSLTFHDLEWGISKEELIEKEFGPDALNGVDYIDYSTSIFSIQKVEGINAIIFYYFEDDKFGYLTCMLSNDETGFEQTYDNYMEIADRYIEEYGDDLAGMPYLTWENESSPYKDQPENYWKAVECGDLIRSCYWFGRDQSFLFLKIGDPITIGGKNNIEFQYGKN